MLQILLPKKPFSIILLVLIVINIIVAAFIFLDIAIVKAPSTNVILNVIDIKADELVLELQLKMYNPNKFDISLEDFSVISSTDNNDKIGEIIIEDGTIFSEKTKIFTNIQKLRFHESSDFEVLNNKISGNIGIIILGFIKKTIPIEMNLTTSLEEIINNIQIPDIDLDFDFKDITNDGLLFNVGIDIYNPNNIGLTINTFELDAYDDNNKNVGNFTIYGGNIEPKNHSFFNSNGMLWYDLLDAQELRLQLSGNVLIKIAGMEKPISLSTEMTVNLPDIQEFIFKNENIEFYIPVQFKLGFRGIKTTVGLKYYNPSNITLVTRNVSCSIYRVDGEIKSELGMELMESCIIDPSQAVCIQTEIIIPYINYFRAGNWRILPDWIVLTIQGDFALAGTRQEVPLSLNAYVNPNLFQNSEFSE